MNPNLSKYKLCFWDFDGVIKESVDVKTNTYFSLFKEFGLNVAEKVKSHHLLNGGMSRFDKFPIYLQWAGITPTDVIVQEYCVKFSKAVKEAVINSNWVNGVQELIKKPKYNLFILVSATPENEILYIMKQLEIDNYFAKIYGSPKSKIDAIAESINEFSIHPSECLMIGDSTSDLRAAVKNKINFILRMNSSNSYMLKDYQGPRVSDFSNF